MHVLVLPVWPDLRWIVLLCTCTCTSIIVECGLVLCDTCFVTPYIHMQVDHAAKWRCAGVCRKTSSRRWFSAWRTSSSLKLMWAPPKAGHSHQTRWRYWMRSVISRYHRRIGTAALNRSVCEQRGSDMATLAVWRKLLRLIATCSYWNINANNWILGLKLSIEFFSGSLSASQFVYTEISD